MQNFSWHWWLYYIWNQNAVSINLHFSLWIVSATDPSLHPSHEVDQLQSYWLMVTNHYGEIPWMPWIRDCAGSFCWALLVCTDQPTIFADVLAPNRCQAISNHHDSSPHGDNALCMMRWPALSGGWFNVKMLSYQNTNSHFTTILSPQWVFPSLYWIKAQGPLSLANINPLRDNFSEGT